MMCSSSGPVRTSTRSPSEPRRCPGVTSWPERADSHGKRAPSRPSAAETRVAVPEHGPAVGVAGQPARTDRRLALLPRAREQMEDREPDCQLQLWIAFDQYVGVSPPRRPRLAVLAQQLIESKLS